MEDIFDLVRQYTRFDALDPVSRLAEIEYGGLAKLIGTVDRAAPSQGYKKVYMGGNRKQHRQRSTGRRIDIGFVLEGSKEYITFGVETPDEDAIQEYFPFQSFLEGLGDEVVEVVIKTERDEDKPIELYMIFGGGKYYMRGFRKGNTLKELDDESLIELGIKDPPEQEDVIE